MTEPQDCEKGVREAAREHFMEATALLGEKAYEELLDMVESFVAERDKTRDARIAAMAKAEAFEKSQAVSCLDCANGSPVELHKSEFGGEPYWRHILGGPHPFWKCHADDIRKAAAQDTPGTQAKENAK
jgi:hypothetical protein